MLLEPIIGLLLRANDFGAGKARDKDGGAVLASLIASGLGENRPEVGLVEILVHTECVPVVSTECALGDNVALLRGTRKPTYGFGVILNHTVSGGIMRAHRELRSGITIVRESTEGVQVVTLNLA